jgi:hypothetical protein
LRDRLPSIPSGFFQPLAFCQSLQKMTLTKERKAGTLGLEQVTILTQLPDLREIMITTVQDSLPLDQQVNRALSRLKSLHRRTLQHHDQSRIARMMRRERNFASNWRTSGRG